MRHFALDPGGRFARVARAFSRAHDVEVVFRGVDCKTDGRVIYLPANVEHLGEDATALMEGLLDHEWLHVREETEHRARGERTPLERMRELDPATKLMMNAFEDARIEREGSALWAGVESNLAAMGVRDAELRAKMTVADAAAVNPWLALAQTMIQAMQGTDIAWAPPAARRFVDGPLAELVTRGRVARNAEETEQLAREAVDIVRAELAAAAVASGDMDERDDERAILLEGLDVSGFEVIVDFEGIHERAMKEIARAAREDAKATRRYIPLPEAVAGDRIIDPLTHARSTKEQDDAVMALRERAATVSGSLRSRIVAVLRARSQRVVRPDRERGRIDGSALHGLRLGNRRVFEEPVPGIEDDIAVSVLVDLSGSTSHESRSRVLGADISIYDFGKIAAYSIAEVLSPLSVPFEIFGFDNDNRPPVPVLWPSPWTRDMSFRYWRAKTFDDRWNATARRRLAMFRNGSQNVDGEAVEFMARRLLARKESRLVLFVFSDGEPAGGCTDPDNEVNLHRAIARVAAAGIQVVGFGMQCAEVLSFYGTGAHGPRVQGFNVEDLDGLASAVLAALGKRLMSDRRMDARA